MNFGSVKSISEYSSDSRKQTKACMYQNSSGYSHTIYNNKNNKIYFT